MSHRQLSNYRLIKCIQCFRKVGNELVKKSKNNFWGKRASFSSRIDNGSPHLSLGNLKGDILLPTLRQL